MKKLIPNHKREWKSQDHLRIQLLQMEIGQPYNSLRMIEKSSMGDTAEAGLPSSKKL